MKWLLRKKPDRAEEEAWWHSGGPARFFLRLLREGLARLGAVVFVAATAVVYAQTFSWDPAQNSGASDGSGTWDSGTLANWTNGSAAIPWNNSGSISASIGAANAGTASAPDLITIATSTTINVAGITFNNVTPYVSSTTGENTGYTIAATDATSILNLEGTGQIVDNTAATTVSLISAAISGSAGLSLSGTGTLALTGINTYTGGTTIAAGSTLQIGNGTSAGTLVGNVTDNGVLVFDSTGLINNITTTSSGPTIIHTNNVISGTGSIIVEAGTVDLPGADTYSGGTTLQAGTIEVQNYSSLGSSSAPLVINGGTLDLGGYSFTVASLNGTGGKITDNGVSGVLTVSAGGTYAGTLADGSGHLGLTLSSGTLILTGASTYSGTTTVTAGTLQIGNGGTTGSLTTSGGISDGGALVFDNTTSGVTSTVSGVISGTGTLTQEGAGSTLVLTGANTYTGGTTISAGTIQIGSGSTSGTISLTSNIADNGALVFDTIGTSRTFSGVISGSGTVTQEGSGSTLIFNNTQTYTGGTTITTGSTVQIGSGGSTGGIDASGAILDNGSLVFNTTNATPFTFTGTVSGSGTVSQSGAGSTLVLGGANTYTGGTIVNAGTLQVGSAQALGASSGALTVNGGTFDLNGYSITVGTLTGGNGTVLDNGASATLTFGGTGGAGTFTFGGIIANGTGILSLNQIGGAEFFGGANTYTGGTTLSGGTLSIGNGQALGPATNNLVINGGALDLENFSVTVNTLNGGVGAVTSLLGSGTLTVNNGGYFAGTINDGTNGTVTLNQTGGTLILTGNNQYSGATTISAGTLQFGSGGPNGTFNSSGTVLSANITDNGALIFDTASSTAVSNITGVLSGSGTLTQEGAGSTLILGSANTFSGGTTLTAGTIQTGNSGALDGSSGALVMNGGTLDLHGTPLTLGSLNGTGGTILSNTGNATFTLGSGLFLGSLTDGTGGTLALDAAGGTIILLGANTYTGGTTVASGTLQVGNGGSAGSISGAAGITDNGTLIADRSGNITISGAISGSGNFTQAGTGTVTLSSADTYSGTTTLNGGGTVNLTTGSGSLKSSSKLTFSGGGGTFNFNNTGVSSTKSQQLGVLAFNGGAGEVLATYGSSGNVGTITFSSLASRAAGATGNFVTSGGTNGTNNTIVLGGQATGFIDPGIYYDGGTSSASYAFYDSTGYVRGINYGTDSGSLLSTGGTLITDHDTGTATTVSSTTNVEITGAIGGQTTLQIGTLQISGANNFTQAGGTLTVNGILKTGGNSSTLSGGNLTAGSGDLVLSADESGDVLTINDTITSATTGGLTKSGAGQVVLGAANAYTGTTTVDAGTLTLGNAGALGSSSNGLTVNGGTLDLAGNSITVGNLNGGGANATVLSSGSAATLTISNGGTYAGALANGSGTLSLVSSAGTLTLTGANTYSGSTTVNGGTLQIGTPAGGGSLTTSGSVTLANGTSLVFNSPGATSTLSGGVSGAGAVTQLGLGGTLILSGTNSYSGATTITNGTLQIGNGGAGGTLSSSSVIDNCALIFDTTSNLTYSGSISGTGTVTQAGAGSTLILNGSDTYTGATLVAAGTLELANGNTQSAVTVTGGTLDLHGHSTTFEVLDGTAGTILTNTANATLTVSQGGSYGGNLTDGTSGVLTLLQTGGTLALSGANTYSGGTTIASGVLTVAGPGSLPGSVTIDTNSSLQFLGGGTYANAIAVSGVGSDAANTETITGALDFNAANATANLTGPITLGGASVFTNSAAGTETWNFTGGLTGTGGVTFTAAGPSGQVTFGLGGTNTFTGAVIVNQAGQGDVAPAQNATLQLLSANAFPTGTVLDLNSSAGLITSLDLNGYNATVVNLGGSTLGTSQIINTSATGATFTVNNAGNETWDGTVGGTPYGSGTAANNLSLAVTGTTDLVLTGSNTYTGTTTIGSGSTLQLGNGGANGNLGGGAVTDNGALIFDAAVPTSAPNAISGSGTLTQESGYGHTLTISGADTYTGATTLAGGNITLAGATGSLNGGTGTALNFKSFNGAAGGTFTYDNTGASGAASQGMGALTFTAGEGAVVSILGGASSSTLTFSPLAARVAGATGDFITTGGTNGSTNTIVLTNESAGFIDRGIFYDGGTASATYAYYDAGNFVRGLNYGVDAGTILSTGGATIASSDTGNAGSTISSSSHVETTGAVTAQTTVQINTLQISGANNFTQAAGSILTVGGILKSGGNAATLSGGSLTSGSASDLVIRTDEAGDILTLSEPILATTTGGVTKSGAGTLLLLATNAYTGGTVVDAGTLQLGNGTTAGSISGTGAVTLEGGSSLVLDQPGTSVFSNSIAGAGGLTQQGTGTLLLTGSDSYSGLTTISSGTLQVGNGTSGSLSPSSQVIDNSALVIDTAAFSSNISGTGTVSFLGSGTVSVTGAQTYTGTTIIDGGGTLNLYASIGSLNGTTGTPLTFSGAGGTFELNNEGEAGPKGLNMGTLTFAGGEGEVLSVYGSTGDVATLTFSSLAPRVSGATGDFVTNGGANGSTNTIVLTGQATGFIDPGLFYDGGTSSASFAYYDSGGFVRGINYGVDSGSILSTGGANIGSNDSGNASSTLSSTSNVEITGAITAQGATQIGTLQIAGANNFTQSGGTLTVNGILKSGGNAATISGGSLASGSGDLVLRADQALDTLTISDSITSSGGVTKSGAGEVILSGGNSYTGTTTVDAGKLQMAGSNALGSTANGLVVNGGTLDLNGNSLTAGSLNGAGGTILGDGTVNLYLNGGGTYAGVIGNGTGNLSLNQSSGTLVLTGANTYTGATTLTGSGTTLQLGSGGTTGSLAAADNISIGSGDALVYDNASTTTSVSGNITGGGSLTQEGIGNTLILTGADSYSGGTTISAGTIQVGNGSTTGSLSAASGVTDNGALVFDTTTNTTFAGAITGTGSLTQEGTSTLILTQNDTYSGGTTIASGSTLQVDNGGTTGALDPTANIADNGTLVFDSGSSAANPVLSGTITGTGKLTQAGGNTVILAAAESYSGGTTISGGTLQVGNGGPTGSLAPAGNITDNGALVFNTTAASTTISGMISGTGTLTQEGAGNTLILTANSTGSAGYTGSVTVGANSTLQLGNGGNTGSLASASGITDNGALVFNANTTSNTYSGVISGTGTLTQDGPGILYLTGINTYSGGTFVLGGTLQIGQGATGSIVGNVTDNASLVFSNSTAATFAGVFTGTGEITDDSDLALTLTGASAATFTGEYYVEGAQLIASGPNVLGNAASVVLGPGTTLDISGTNSSQTIGSLASNALTDSGATVNLGANTLTVGNSSNTVFTGAIQGTQGALVKQGSGTLALTGTNTYTGGTTINAGTLQIGNGTTTGTLPGTGAVTDNGNLAFDLTSASTVLGQSVTGTGSLTEEGANNILIVTTGEAYTGGTTIAAGSTVQVGNGGPMGSLAAAGNITDNGALVFDTTTNASYSGAIGGTGSLTQEAGNTLTLTGNNSYSGPTTISHGTLLANSSTGSATGTGNVSVSTGATLGGNGTIAPAAGNGITIAAGATLDPGIAPVGSVATGALTLANASTTAPILTLAAPSSSQAQLTFDLGSGAAPASSGGLTFAGSSNYLAIDNLNGDSPGEIVFNNNIAQIADLTSGHLASGDYLLIQASSNSDYANLVTQNGVVTSGLSLQLTTGFQTQYTPQLVLTNGDLYLVVGAVPEPGEWTLLLSGLALVFLQRRFSRRARS